MQSDLINMPSYTGEMATIFDSLLNDYKLTTATSINSANHLPIQSNRSAKDRHLITIFNRYYQLHKYNNLIFRVYIRIQTQGQIDWATPDCFEVACRERCGK